MPSRISDPYVIDGTATQAVPRPRWTGQDRSRSAQLILQKPGQYRIRRRMGDTSQDRSNVPSSNTSERIQDSRASQRTNTLSAELARLLRCPYAAAISECSGSFSELAMRAVAGVRGSPRTIFRCEVRSRACAGRDESEEVKG